LYKPWGEPRYASGSLPTDYTFTGQYSHVSDFGLLFFVARWYDPALGRFAQADTIVPGIFNPAAFDRYAYVLNNPLRYIDPSGNLSCSAPNVAAGDCWDPPNPDEISLIPPPPYLIRYDVPGIGTQDGRPGYDGLMALVNQQDAWWWADGVFTLEEALALILFSEASLAWAPVNGIPQLPQAVIDAAAYKWQQYCGGGWYTSSCFIGFWSYFEPLRNLKAGSRQMNEFRKNNLNDPQMYGGDVYLRGAASVLTHPAILRGNNVPQGWVSIHAGQEAAYDYIYNASVGPNAIVSYKKWYVEDGVSWYFVVLSVSQQNTFCGVMGMSAMCNLTGVP
jgi:RHS repeat-associated protein